MPTPGTRSILAIMSAKFSWPWARSPSTNCSLVAPAGSCLPTTPAKITSMAWPRIRGAITFRTTATVTMASTAAIPARSGFSSPMSRFAEGQNCWAFLAGMAPNIPPSASPGVNSSSWKSSTAAGVPFPLALMPLPPRSAGIRQFPGRCRSFPEVPHACPGPRSGPCPAPGSGPHRRWSRPAARR